MTCKVQGLYLGAESNTGFIYSIHMPGEQKPVCGVCRAALSDDEAHLTLVLDDAPLLVKVSEIKRGEQYGVFANQPRRGWIEGTAEIEE